MVRNPGVSGRRWRSCLITLLMFQMVLPIAWRAKAETPAPYHIYIDADWTHSLPSSRAIEWGIKTALRAIDNKISGFPMEIRRIDHRANTKRHLKNQKTILADDRALAVFTGLHSPPLLANKQFINTNEILTLDPWAAAGPITRSPEPNWIFRLSVDDAVAGRVIVEHAVKNRGFKNLVLIAEDTGWGRFNNKNMSAMARELKVEQFQVLWSNWGISKPAAKILLRQATNRGADAILLVTNPAECVVFAQAAMELEPSLRRPFQSHWGCSSGGFAGKIGPEALNSLDMEFIQSRFSFLWQPNIAHAGDVLNVTRQMFPELIAKAEDIRPPAAFIHAHDLTMLLIAAAKQAKLTGDLATDRQNLREALLDLRKPVRGLIKTYEKPFSPWSPENSDGHEALGREDYVMARYDEQGRILMEPR
ncbi:ABC transporter substrate-binding protein [Magnetospira sp. QH-2]|uniref:ABC transporter substrate-binding protein n=1 Tax=Magnetospira sp. (strain QH-2) TaxID=1288970 RepID=UPI0003E81B71|nr:ABC transporter substrate-binding protein [Magnetospira sp. QH-2]CCQ74198.1 Conserved protein of unknown function [Magnetospira sp. QH-2]